MEQKKTELNHNGKEEKNPNIQSEPRESRELTELELENERLRMENERLKQLEEYRRNTSVKDRMYDKIHVSLKTMDIIIGCLLALLVVVLILGLVNR